MLGYVLLDVGFTRRQSVTDEPVMLLTMILKTSISLLMPRLRESEKFQESRRAVRWEMADFGRGKLNCVNVRAVDRNYIYGNRDECQRKFSYSICF